MNEAEVTAPKEAASSKQPSSHKLRDPKASVQAKTTASKAKLVAYKKRKFSVSGHGLDKLEEKEKTLKAKPVTAKDREFLVYEHKSDFLIHKCDSKKYKNILSSLNANSQQVLGKRIFTAHLDKTGILVSKENYKQWLDQLEEKGKTPKAKPVSPKNRKFLVYEHDYNLLIHKCNSKESISTLNSSLNRNSQQALSKKIFSVNSDKTGVLVSKKDYKQWLDKLEEKGREPKVKPVAVKDREFLIYEHDFDLLIHKCDSERSKNILPNLNRNSQRALGKKIFKPSPDKAGILVSKEDYKKWLDKLEEKEKTLKTKPVAAKDREFLVYDHDSDLLIHKCDSKKSKNILRCLNDNSQRALDRKIFKFNSDDRAEILVSKEDYNQWQDKLKEKEKCKTSRSKAIALKDRKFSISEHDSGPGLLVYRCVPQKLNNILHTLRKNAQTVALKHIFSRGSEAGTIIVRLSDYRLWLERNAEKDNSYQAILNEFNLLHPEFSDTDIHVGIADKYLNFDSNLPMLPQSANSGGGVALLPNQLTFTSSLFSSPVKRNEYVVRNESATLKLYGTKNIMADEKVIFVFAGRKENASYPDNPGCRVVAVMTEDEYKQSHLPEHIDILVIQRLSSDSHGEYADNLGCINSRRIAAMLAAHEYELKNCIFMDDNLESINTQELFNWEQLFNALSTHAKDRVCLSVGTHQSRKALFANDTIGSKLFMINMAKLKERFPNIKDMFSLFFSHSASNFWTEDFVMQLVMVAAFGRASVGVADRELFSLSRLKQYTNTCAKVFRKAEVHTQQEPIVFLRQHFNADELSSQQIEWLTFALATLKRIVEENIQYRKDRAQGLADIDLIEKHASANGIALPAKQKEEGATSSSIKDFELYPHQKKAIQSIKKSQSKFSLIKMATGSGKTRVQMTQAQIDLAAKSPEPVFIVAPTQQLVQQFYGDFIRYINTNSNRSIQPHQVVKISSHTSDIHVSLLQANKSLENKKLVMIFCAASFLKYIEQSDIIVPQRLFLDECHKFSQEQINAIKIRFNELPTKIVALSATPSKEMGHAIYEYNRVQAVKDKIVSPFIMDTWSEDYSRSTVGKKIDELNTILKNQIHPNGSKLNQLKGVIYLPSINDVETVYNTLKNNIDVFKAHSKESHLDEKIKQFKKTKAPCVILAVGMLRVGFSDKNIDYELILRSAQADDVKQIIGRVLRYKEGKVGYVLGFRDIDTSSLVARYDEEALDMCSEKFKSKSPHLFAAYSKHKSFMLLRDTLKKSRNRPEGKPQSLDFNEEENRSQKRLYYRDIYSLGHI